METAAARSATSSHRSLSIAKFSYCFIVIICSLSFVYKPGEDVNIDSKGCAILGLERENDSVKLAIHMCA